jgi:uncharacterized protein GlcG (DUF336 family)
MKLTLADANRVIAGAIAKATEIGAKMNIAVCDAGGRLVAFQRMDGAMWAGSYGSQGKAVASAAFGRPSGELTPRADHPTLRGIVMAEGNHMFLGQGAVPIFRGGVLIGASSARTRRSSRGAMRQAPAANMAALASLAIADCMGTARHPEIAILGLRSRIPRMRRDPRRRSPEQLRSILSRRLRLGPSRGVLRCPPVR